MKENKKKQSPLSAILTNLVCENQSTGCGDTSWMKFVTLIQYKVLLLDQL